jgi:hypothetical protein
MRMIGFIDSTLRQLEAGLIASEVIWVARATLDKCERGTLFNPRRLPL